LRWLWTATLLLAGGADLVSGQSSALNGFQPYSLQHRQAQDVAPQLRNLLQGLPSPANVVVDPELNRLLVQGPAEAQQVARQFVQALDQPTTAAKLAGAVPPDVQGYRVPTGDLKTVAARLQSEFGRISGVRIAVDDRTGQIIVVAPAQVQKQVAERIAPQKPAPQTEVEPSPSSDAAPTATGITHQLRNISWRELEDALKTAWGPQIQLTTSRGGEVATLSVNAQGGTKSVLEIDRRSDVVHMLGSADSGAWLNAVRAMDAPRVAGDDQTRLVFAPNADPAQIRSAVSLIRAASQATDDSTAVAVKPLSSTNQPRWGGALVSMLFQEAPAGSAAPTPAAPAAPPAGETAAPAPPAESAPAPGGEAPAAPGAEEGVPEEGGLLGPVQIEYLEGLDAFVVKGNKRDVARVMQIIEDIEKMSAETRPEVDIYTLKHVNGESLVTLLNELYTEVLSARQGQVSIRALGEPNAILLIGRKESVTVVRELIDKLDQPTDPSYQFQIFPLKHISAVDAETAVRNFFVTRPGDDTEPRTALGTQVRVLADYRSNSLIVQASPRDLLEVKRLIEGIDVEDSTTSAVIRVFRLKNALADDLRNVIQGAITGQTTGQTGAQGTLGTQGGGQAGGTTQNRANMPSSSLEFMMIDQQGGRLLRSGILANAQITSDPNINALVVRAPAKSMDLIAALIEQLDQVPDAKSQIKVFTVMNGDATSLTQLLQQLFGQQVTAGTGTTGGLFGTNFGAFNQTQLQTGAGAGESSLVPLRFGVDMRTNSIIASGSEGDLTVVEALLLRLDEGDLETRKVAVVRLKNAPAADVATALTNLLTNERTLIQQRLLTTQAISAFEQIEREVIVVAEEVTNSLIVSATPQYYTEIMQIIEDLDFRPPMVMVQVLIGEIQLDEAFEFGVEWGLQESLLFDRGIATTPSTEYDPGFNFNNVGLPNLNDASRSNLAGQTLQTFGLGRTNPALGYGGLVLSAASDSINILVRALQDSGRLQVLSRPQVMTLNNQQAFVQVGATQSRITGSTVSQGIVQNQITDVDTGLILRIQPLINDDGIIVMNVDAERSELGNEVDGPVVAYGENGEPIRSPPINRTTAQTTISARSGQTVAFAGLITKDRLAVIRRIPYISDIPVVGRLFEYTSTAEKRRELLIVMTPYIIQSDEDYEWIKILESERMSWCLADVVQLHGDFGLQGPNCMFCQPTVPVLYPDSDPLGFTPPPSTGMAAAEQFQLMGSPGPLPPSTMANQSLAPVPESGSTPPAPPVADETVTPAPTPAEPGPDSGARLAPPYPTPGAPGPPPAPGYVQAAQYAPRAAVPATNARSSFRLPPTQ
jgi:type II secretion system protein D